jgi:hypothetical protein
MKIPAFDDFKRAVPMSTHAQATKRSARQGSRSVWPLALACGFLIFVTGSSIYLVVSAQAAGELVNRTLQIETKLFIMLSNVRGRIRTARLSAHRRSRVFRHLSCRRNGHCADHRRIESGNHRRGAKRGARQVGAGH